MRPRRSPARLLAAARAALARAAAELPDHAQPRQLGLWGWGRREQLGVRLGLEPPRYGRPPLERALPIFLATFATEAEARRCSRERVEPAAEPEERPT